MLHNDLDKLNKYPFHMPGHKRNNDLGIIGSKIDITEIDGFDNLHSANGSIKEIEDNLASMYNANRSFMLINGSTVGLLSAVFALTNPKDKIIIARNCHKSVYNACYLRELDVVYIEPNYDDTDGYYTSISQEEIDRIINDNPDAKAVVITSPTYEGNISDIQCELPLIIDCAHGAHFGFWNFPKYPKADIVVSSLHKTLPCLTQTAVLNVYNSKYIDEVQKYLDIFETSSPSYILMNSVSKCIEILNSNNELFTVYENNLKYLYDLKLNNLIYKIGDDKGKIVISTAQTNINGIELSEILRNKYNIECEMASVNYVILMTSVGDTSEGFDLLKNALKEIDKTLVKTDAKKILKPLLPEKAYKSSDVKNTIPVDFSKSNKKISGEYVYAYPPDIPIIVPGEVLTEEIINSIKNMISNGVNIISDSNLLPTRILTKSDK